MNTTNYTANLTRVFPAKSKWGYGPGHLIKVTAKAELIGGNRHPHFSVTAEIYKPGKRDFEACGCLHTEILQVWPEIAPIVALHLSNSDDGEPMHGEANGFYWLAGALGGLGERYHGGSSDVQIRDKDGNYLRYGKPDADYCLGIFADHCRILVEEAQGIARAVRDAFNDAGASVATSEEVTERTEQEKQRVGNLAAKADWKVICDDMRQRWKTEAEAGLAFLNNYHSTPEQVAA